VWTIPFTTGKTITTVKEQTTTTRTTKIECLLLSASHTIFQILIEKALLKFHLCPVK
jgi:hypothetical protein